eukprot:TRINITY_DN12711_c0_g1_i1.p1 TRINITY_DN12711_c0_g1~~TRINITY_DN12711_c0_g1_i1.p1  ORF type:complete len:470 (+),score=63.29 TRINITY_DN12711_c0_g1_i1:70-1479(+)
MVVIYDAGSLQLGAICRFKGSVLPKAFMVAFVPAVFAIGLGTLVQHTGMDYQPILNAATYSSFTFVLGFLLVFRNQTAYARYWEGTSHIQVLRGSWINAFSTLLAFSNASKKETEEIAQFQLKAMRLFSALHACALDFMYGRTDGVSNILGIDQFENGALEFMNQVDNESMVFVVSQWIQQLILGAMADGIITSPPPIVGRVFQDITGGVVMTQNARKLTDTPFPFPYCQVLQVCLLIHAMFTPAAFVSWCREPVVAGVLTFIAVTVFWSLNFISAEIEHPFGFDPNDIRIELLQERFNTRLMTVIHPMAHTIPLKSESVGKNVMVVPEVQYDTYANTWAKRSSTFASYMNDRREDPTVEKLYTRCGQETAELETKLAKRPGIANGTKEGSDTQNAAKGDGDVSDADIKVDVQQDAEGTAEGAGGPSNQRDDEPFLLERGGEKVVGMIGIASNAGKTGNGKNKSKGQKE